MEYQYASPNNSRFIECANPGWGSTFFSECANPGWGSTFFPECVLNITEDQCASTNNTTEGSIFFANPVTEDEDEDEDEDDEDEYFDDRQIYKLPRPKELMKIDEKDYYTPKIVSFGPYYHDESKRKQELKQSILTKQISKYGKDEKVFYRQIFKRINKIRNCYVRVTEDDRALTEMMLLDASFAACIMMSSLKNFSQSDSDPLTTIEEELGYDVIRFIRMDMLLLENQIPLWVIMRFLKLISGKEQDGGRVILYAFVNQMARLDREILSIPKEDEKQPLHLLDAIYRVLVQHVEKCQCFSRRRNEDSSPYSAENRQFRSVTDLKAKGIDCKPSSQCLNDIDFKSETFTWSGELQLPVLFFHQYSKKLFINLVAYEKHPKRSARPKQKHSPGAVSAYVNFLKSLAIKPEDVRELRERKILFSSLNGDENVLKVIKEISIPRGDSELEYVKKGIEDHCRCWFKAKCRAKLKHKINNAPWSIIAFLAAAALLILTFFQTYYTMKYHN